MTSKYCTNCGAELSGGQFCQACGAHVADVGDAGQAAGAAGESPTVAPGAMAAPSTQPPGAAPPPPSASAPGTGGGGSGGNNKLLIILGVAVVAALLILGGILLFTTNNGSTPTSTSQSPSTVTLPSPTQAASSTAPSSTQTATATITATATATVTAVPPVVPVGPNFSGCPSGFTYVGDYGGYHTCRNASISDGFAANIAVAVSGPGQYTGVYSPAHDKEYYFRCIATGGSTSPVDCGYQPTNISNGGIVRLYPIG